VLELIQGLPWPAVLLVSALILAGEPALLVGVILPSVSTALGLGFLANAGTLPLPLALGTAAAAVIVGDFVSYAVGRRRSAGSPQQPFLRQPANQKGAQPARRGLTAQRWLTPKRQARVTALVARHGGRAIFLARWVVGARTLVPRLTGSGGTTLWAFARWSVPAGLAWSSCYVLGGYLAGNAYQQVSAVAGQASLALLGLAVAVAGAFAAGRWAGRNSELPARLLSQLLGRRRLTPPRSAPPRLAPPRLAPLAGPLALILLFALVAAGLTVLVAFVVRGSGLPRLDGPLAAALASRPNSRSLRMFLMFTPGTAVIAAAAALALCRPVTSGRHRTGPLSGLATGGATLPLAILTVVLHGTEIVARRDDLFATQNALLTTAAALATWALARKRLLRAARGGVWALGAAIVLFLAAARLYVGWGTLSSTVAAMLIGLIWAGVFAAAWTARPSETLLASGGGANPAETAAPEDGYLAPPMQHAVVKVGEGLDLVPAVAGGSRLATVSAVQLEHLGALPLQLAHLARPAHVPAD
jgi:membrane protein DedA with SNARE-associated domain